MRFYLRFSAVALISITLSGVAHADWLQFRGPNGTGISDEPAETPTEWSPDSLKWKAALPGPGSSCPIVVGNKVLVTCWTGYGTDEAGEGGQDGLRRHLICFDKNNGNELWRKTVEPFLPEDQYGGMFAEHGYASHTPASDGTHVFAFFGKTGVVAFDLDGKELWKTSVGTESGARNWGSASSPILFEDLVIVPATAESESIIALDKASGKQVWKAEAAGFNSTWGSPVLTTVDGRTDVVIAIPGEVWGLNAETGKLAWYSDGVPASSMCSSAVADASGTVYAIESGPGGGGGVAIRSGGTKNVSESHVVWAGNQSNRISTPLFHDGKLYTIANKIVTCLDASTGKTIYEKRLRANASAAPSGGDSGGGGRRGGRRGRGGQDYGSPIMADGKIYYTARNGETFVVQVGDKFEQLASNFVTSEREDFSATPAVSEGNLFIRSSKHLYCVGK